MPSKRPLSQTLAPGLPGLRHSGGTSGPVLSGILSITPGQGVPEEASGAEQSHGREWSPRWQQGPQFISELSRGSLVTPTSPRWQERASGVCPCEGFPNLSSYRNLCSNNNRATAPVS